eukprot:TRINITY_DN2502_c1_g1_i1.p1 TRINITY_DN2502_c1_g1~~TRINITY_DN2502_c1_g1_i1.p1  ORF type:complete len:115 (-),score=18.92 TRINITY_DN2502_c1_g1_i1:886-1230(-)
MFTVGLNHPKVYTIIIIIIIQEQVSSQMSFTGRPAHPTPHHYWWWYQPTKHLKLERSAHTIRHPSRSKMIPYPLHHHERFGGGSKSCSIPSIFSNEKQKGQKDLSSFLKAVRIH